MKIYHFTITLAGGGDNPDEAWEDAIEAFSLEPRVAPDNYEIVQDDNDGD
jgi:hypothetical protein